MRASRGGKSTQALCVTVIVFSSFSAARAESDDVLSAQLRQGEAIYIRCAACHGADGQASAMPQYPKLFGQNGAYLKNALRAYRDGRRLGSYAAIMAENAKPLSDEEIDGVVAYIDSFAHAAAK